MFNMTSFREAISKGFFEKPRVFRFKLLDGSKVWSANTGVPNHGRCRTSFQLYKPVASGTHQIRAIAVRKSINEAFERFAFESLVSDDDLRVQLGFDICPDTTGMAARESGFSFGIRKAAYHEACERWAIEKWWDGGLPVIPIEYDRASSGGVNGVEIVCPFDTRVVITWKDFPKFRVYGFSGAETFLGAYQNALVEMSRNAVTLEIALNALSQTEVISNRAEKRLIHFAGPQGVREFEARICASSTNLRNQASKMPIMKGPRLIVDQELKGPWSPYARVWRCLLEGTRWLGHPETDRFAF